METILQPPTTRRQEHDMFRTISIGALVTGSLYLLAAAIKFFIEFHQGPVSLFRYIASAAFGKEIASSGTLMIIWGLVFHFINAFLFTAFLFLIYPSILKWLKNKMGVAIVSGLFTWSVMNLLVLPFSRINKYPSDLTQVFIGILLVVLTIGIPVAFMSGRYYCRYSK